MSDAPQKTVFLETFGCQMNFLDSELVIGQFRRMGLRIASDRDSADIILFNTCAVRDHAEQKVTSRLGELRQVKADRPGVIIGVIGCQAEREGKLLISRFPHIDVLCGPSQLDRLPDLIAEAQATRKRAVALSGGVKGRQRDADPEGNAIERLDQSRAFAPGENPLQAYVRVQRGCDKFCAYCVVPGVRGKEKSRKPENIVADCRRLVEAGCREITLLGQTVNSYVQNDAAGQPVTLARLLEQLCGLPNLLRLRFVTSYPGGFDENILRVMAAHPAICPYLHIPAQSGSDRMLNAMRRQYTAADYLRLMDRAREIVPGISLAGDFIVGFPGETESDFAATVEMVRRVRYKNCFVFKYSPRPGTAAAQLPDDVPDDVKRERNNILLAEQAAISSQTHAELVGQRLSVLVEGPSKSAIESPAGNPRQLTGRTVFDQIVVFDCPAGAEPSQLAGRLAEVRILHATPYTLIGELATIESAGAPNDSAPLRYKSLTVIQ
ncbi:MAG: tRNA (N6-isopentenyl adenosine(37)-C2)-methylthiotransferase MiaB [Phycisphaerae bacterium]|nr:tRNA (N6-isopentenyl adenosine(37)-C2)-methylthiotransferase MiaB [Phycisphaerae bacterium]